MRILMLCRLFSPHVGGVETHVLKISREAARAGNEVEIITSQYAAYLPRKARLLTQSREEFDLSTAHHVSRPIFVYRIPGLLFTSPVSRMRKGRERISIYWWMMCNARLFWNADIIHIHDVFFWYWPLRFLLPWKKVYITFHGFEAGQQIRPSVRTARSLAERFTKGNMCVGSWIEQWYGTHPTLVTYGGADCIALEPKKLVTTSSSSSKRAVFLGRLEEDTAVLEYLRAVEGVKMKCDVYGDGSKRPEVEKIAKRYAHIQYMGIATDTCPLFSTYSIAFVSSYLSILEAMQMRIPIVAFATSPLKKAYLLSHPQAANISIVTTNAKLESLLHNWNETQEHEKATRAYAWAKKQTWENVYDQYTQLWSEKQK